MNPDSITRIPTDRGIMTLVPMARPKRSICKNILAILFVSFAPKLYLKNEMKRNLRIAVKYKSLPWLLKAWFSKYKLEQAGEDVTAADTADCEYMKDGSHFVDLNNALGAQIDSTGAKLIRYDALIFPEAHIKFLDINLREYPNYSIDIDLGMTTEFFDDTKMLHSHLFEFPQIDYSNDPLTQLEEHIARLYSQSMVLTKIYNMEKHKYPIVEGANTNRRTETIFLRK